MPATDGVPIPLSVFSPANTDRATAAPCVYWMHGGGMVMGDRFSQLDIPLEWLDRFGAVVVSVDYRLAPEATGTTLVDDCYRGLLWVAEHAAELGIDPARIVVAGASAGGGLAAGVTLLARDLGTPAIAAQMLICPMLDHRNTSTSSRQYADGPGVWTGGMNEFGWRSVLGDLTGEEIPPYVSPALADDLSGLPTTYIDTGSAEVFRDEDADYATRIWSMRRPGRTPRLGGRLPRLRRALPPGAHLGHGPPYPHRLARPSPAPALRRIAPQAHPRTHTRTDTRPRLHPGGTP